MVVFFGFVDLSSPHKLIGEQNIIGGAVSTDGQQLDLDDLSCAVIAVFGFKFKKQAGRWLLRLLQIKMHLLFDLRFIQMDKESNQVGLKQDLCL